MPPTPLGHFLGARPDPFDPRDYPFTAAPPAVLPPAVDLRQYLGPVKDQGQAGTCVGQATSGLMEFRARKAGSSDLFAAAFVYYEACALEGNAGDPQVGCFPRDAFKALQKLGCCSEADDPYKDSVSPAPSTAALADALAHRIPSYHRISGLLGLKTALASGQACVLGVQVYPSFEKPVAGHIPMPAHGESLLGGHAILAFQYQDDPAYPGGGWVGIRNSWGSSWGDGGNLYAPYAYIANHKLTSDIWTAP